MTKIENRYRVSGASWIMTADIQLIPLHQKKVDEIRENSLNHLRLSYMTEIVQTANRTGADLKNLGQGSNKRALRRPDPNGNDVAMYKDTTASANQRFYWTTKIMWDDRRKRERADPEMASQGRVLPRPFDFIQAEMIESGVGGHRMQWHSEKEEKRPGQHMDWRAGEATVLRGRGG